MAQQSNFIVRGGLDVSNINKGLAKTQQQFSNFQKNLSFSMKLVTAALAGLSVGKLIKDSVNSVMTVESSIGQISRTMGDSSIEFSKWSETQAKSFGIARAEAYKYGAVYSNLISGFTKNTAETTKYTQQLIQASAVVASATGRTMEDTMERIRSGLLGNTEAIEDLGIYAQVGAMEATNAFKKLANGKSWQQLDYNVQQQIRLMSILEQANTKYGDSLAGTTATKQMMFVATLKNIQLNLGRAFLPIYNIILPAITELANKIEVITARIAAFSQALFGQQHTAAQTNKAMGNLSSAAGDVDKNVKKAGKSAKSALSGFDQLNTLTQNTADSMENMSSAASSDVSLKLGATDTDIDPAVLAPFKAALDGILEPLKSISFEPLITSFNTLKTAAEPLVSTLFDGLKWGYDNILVPLADYTISELLPAFLDTLAGAFTLINPILETFKPLGEFLWSNFLLPIANFTGGLIVDILHQLGDALKDVGGWISDNQESIRTMTGVVAGFFGAWKLMEVLAFVQMSGGIVTAFKVVSTAIAANTLEFIANSAAALASKLETLALTAMYAKDFVVGIGKATAAILVNTAETLYLKALYGIDMVKAIGASIVAIGSQVIKWGASTAAIVANKIALVAGAIAQGAMTVAMGAWNVICAIGTGITTAFGVAVAILTSPITLVILGIAALVAGIILLVKNWDTVKEVALNVWEGVKGVWGAVGDWFSSNVVDPIANVFKGLWNGIIDGMNTVIRGLNKIKFDFPDWVPGLGNKSFGISIPSIPRLAKGGLVSAPTLAMVGDNRNAAVDPEVIAPLSKLEGMLGGGNQEMVSVLMQILSAIKNQDTQTILKLNETELGRVSINAINKINRQAGYSLLEV